MTIEIMADVNCKYCRGTGLVTDWVDYGSIQVPMATICDCVLEQVPEGQEDCTILVVEAGDGNSWGGAPIPFDGGSIAPHVQTTDERYGLEAVA
jgi:hypothetical protein